MKYSCCARGCFSSIKFALRVYKRCFIPRYYMARQSWGKSGRSDWFFLARDFAIRTVSMEMVIRCVFFVFESRQFRNKHYPSAI